MRRAWSVASAAVFACGGPRPAAPQRATPQPTMPLPAASFAGQRVMLLPLTLAVADERLGWRDRLGEDRRVTLGRADSILGGLLVDRAPEVTWVRSAELRRAVQMSAGMAGDPSQFPLAVLRGEKVAEVPDPLRTQLRNLAAVSRTRFGLVPAALVWVPADTAASMRAVVQGSGSGTAELTLVMVDTRLGHVVFRTVARGAGDDPWTALSRAVRVVTPGLP